MATQRKIDTVADLTDRMSRMQVAIVSEYRGLTVEEVTNLRRALRVKGAEFVVTKNTLARIAARETGNEALVSLLEGPTAVTFCYEDIPGTAKILNTFIKGLRKDFPVKGAVLGNQVLGPNDLEVLVNMPTKEQSLAKILGGVQAPASRVLGAINAVMRNIAYVLKAHSDKEANSAA